jgi:SWI/SNF-related matrix-associated actin-dependent regulator 1 of chromatin subfamily A
MNLTWSELLQRYEFRLKSRAEKDNSGRLGLAIVGTVGLLTAWERKTDGAKPTPVFHTRDPHRAMQIAEHADEDVKARIRKQVEDHGGPIPVMTYHNGCYVWSGPEHANGIGYKEIPKRSGFVYARVPSTMLPRDAGLKFSTPVWWTEQSVKAALCLEYADELARAQVTNALARRQHALEASRAEDADIEIPVPAGMAPYPFQRAGVAYMKPRKRVLLADQMGLGKSVQAALWINICPEVKRVLIVCPASLKRWWMTVMQTWLVRPAIIGIADSKYSQVVPHSDIVIINYELMSKRVDTGRTKMKDGKIVKDYEHVLRESLKGMWDMLIVDECHKIKGDASQVIRSRMVLSIEAERILFMSGTPMVNRPRELWNICHHLAPKIFPNKRQFLDRYCKGDSFRDPDAGASNLEELQERLRLWIMCRRLKHEVLKDLPPKMRMVIELPAEGCDSLVKGELLAFERKEDVLTTMRLRVELAKASETPEDYKQAVSALKQGIQVAFEELSRIRRETAIAKIPAVIEHVSAILSEGSKVVLFAHHKEVVEKLHAAFSSEALFMHSDTPAKVDDRQLLVDRFQSDESIRLIVGTIGTMGVGFTLTASSYVVMAELSWVPGDVSQAEDRCHRIGTKDSVLIQHLVLEGSLDKRMADVLVEKQDIADRTLDQKSQAQLLDDPIMPDREKMATIGVSANDIAKLAEKMSDEDIARVSMGLRLLQGTHKDSAILDGYTFRAVDAPLGKILAAQKKMSPKMAALGKKLLSRPEYRHALAIVPEIRALFSKEEK